MPLVYCLIARGTEILAEAVHPQHTGNFRQVSAKLLQRVNTSASKDPTNTSNDRQTLLFEGHTFNFVRRGSLWFLAMGDRSIGQGKPFQFITDAIDTYMRATNDGVTRLEGASLRAISDSLSQKLDSYSRDRESDSQHSHSGKEGKASEHRINIPRDPDGPVDESDASLQNVRRELSGVKDVILDNLDRVIARGEALESLVDRSDQLNNSSEHFKSHATKLKRNMCWANARAAVMLTVVAILVIYGIGAAKCGVTLRDCWPMK